MTIPEINNEELKSMMRLFENLSPRKQGYLQGYLAGSETAERNREDKKDDGNKDKNSIPDKE